MIVRVEIRPRSSDRIPTLIGAFDLILAWIERAKQRTELAGLAPDALHDLGLSRADLDTECRKHFWQR